MAGRKTKLTPELIDRVRQYLEKGLSISATCALVGINRITYYRWIEKGEKSKSGLYFEFCNKCNNAQAVAEKRWLEGVETEQKDYKWLLAHRFRKDWGDKVDIGLTEGSVQYDDIPFDEWAG